MANRLERIALELVREAVAKVREEVLAELRENASGGIVEALEGRLSAHCRYPDCENLHLGAEHRYLCTEHVRVENVPDQALSSAARSLVAELARLLSVE
jgi:hypothetical protein